MGLGKTRIRAAPLLMSTLPMIASHASHDNTRTILKAIELLLTNDRNQ